MLCTELAIREKMNLERILFRRQYLVSVRTNNYYFFSTNGLITALEIYRFRNYPDVAWEEIDAIWFMGSCEASQLFG